MIRDSRNARARSFLEQDNIKLLRKLISIKYGDKANVAKADEWRNRHVRNSPLHRDKGHVNFNADHAELERQNKKLV